MLMLFFLCLQVGYFGKLVTNIIDNDKFLPKFFQILLEILNNDEDCDIIIEIEEFCQLTKEHDKTLVHVKLLNILPEPFKLF
ncbi:hypothetical protein C1645_828096 [Glomus cerebriforme]|uniref:Uncharacterized protein n=1 Tax=Glomus cerebriforme TaxID=658196 RepID=A0A397STE0_9GLOM|nr:hypothetical protein C1645_828096 [Glomus cerebriforme]